MTTKRQRDLRARLHERQEGLCHWCGRKTFLSVKGQRRPHLHTATLDHLTESKVDREELCVMACYGCNRSRDNVNGKTQFVAARHRIAIARSRLGAGGQTP